MLLDSLIDNAAQRDKKTIAVAAAEDEEVLEAVVEADRRNLANFFLFGNRDRIHTILEGFPYKSSANVQVIHSESKLLSAESAVRAVSSNTADVLMKGNVPSHVILKAVLNKEFGLRTNKILSHAAVFEIPGFDRLLIITDAGMNISPNLEQKAQIIQNTVSLAKSIGMNNPKVAPIAAVETINPAMQATLDAAALTMMNKRGQIKDCMVDGPLALDNAISVVAARHKGIRSEVAGTADILLVPTIEVGNALYKSLVYFARAKVGSVITGASAPIVLTSRADSSESKLYSLALALSCVKQ